MKDRKVLEMWEGLLTWLFSAAALAAAIVGGMSGGNIIDNPVFVIAVCITLIFLIALMTNTSRILKLEAAEMGLD